MKRPEHITRLLEANGEAIVGGRLVKQDRVKRAETNRPAKPETDRADAPGKGVDDDQL